MDWIVTVGSIIELRIRLHNGYVRPFNFSPRTVDAYRILDFRNY